MLKELAEIGRQVLRERDQLAEVSGVGTVLFLSLCDGKKRADVFSSKGSTVEEALSGCLPLGLRWEEQHGTARWIRMDAVAGTRQISLADFSHIDATFHEMIRVGVSLDPSFETAFLEQECNANKLWVYQNNRPGLSLPAINRYLKETSRGTISALPDSVLFFTCRSWFYGEEKRVIPLSHEGLTYGRRRIYPLDGQTAQSLIEHAGDFLLRQEKEDGSFIYGMDPRSGSTLPGYNEMRHASTLWSLICLYRVTGREDLLPKIDAAFGYLFQHAVKDRGDASYLVDRSHREIKLGGLGVLAVAISEYIDAILKDEKLPVEDREGKIKAATESAVRFGRGILSMEEGETGKFVHVWNTDFSVKDRQRTVYYDGEAAFALARLYGLSGEPAFLAAAKRLVDRFVREDYTKYCDHWVAYAVREILIYCPDEQYMAFAVRNLASNLDRVFRRVTTYHTYLEFLLVGFETVDHLQRQRPDLPCLKELDMQALLRTIYCRADRMLNGYFFPETAMYMACPEKVLDTFMVRHDGFRVRIDDVQHNLCAYYLYWKNYDRLIELGLLDAIRDGFGEERSYGPKI
ncbi:MAG: hypothetical protein ACI4OJ_07755 [Lachnospiraceae bacterium]